MTWQTFAADAPRFVLPDNFLLVEGQRTNQLRNPRGEGTLGVVPSNTGNTTTNLPTNWQIIGSVPTGLTLTCVGTVTLNGLPGVRFSLTGTPSATTNWFISFERSTTANGGPAAAEGQTWVGSCFWRWVSGDLTNLFNPGLQVNARTAAGAVVNNGPRAALDTTGNIVRLTPGAYTLPATTGLATLVLQFVHFDTVTPVSLTFDVAAPQLGLGTFSSTPVLPAVGTPAAATRGADILSSTLSALGIGDSGASAVLMTAALGQAAPAGVPQTLMQVDDGTDANRYVIRNDGGGSAIWLYRATAGVLSAGMQLGTVTPGVPFRVGMSIGSGGRVAGVLNSNAVLDQTGGPNTGLTRLLIGSAGTAGGAEALFGTVGRVVAVPRTLTDGELASRVAALSIP